MATQLHQSTQMGTPVDPERHHGPLYEILDPRFARLVMPAANLWRLATGCQWSEGPVWFPASRGLVWSDVPGDRLLRWDESTGQAGVFRAPSNNANGNTIDAEGRLVTCEQRSRRVTRTGHDGHIEVLADRYEGKRLNSPNDVVVAADGAIWFTDPAYGIDNDYEGRCAEPEIDGCYVFRLDLVTGRLECKISKMVRPNGLAFSPDGDVLYVADTGATHIEDGPRHIRRFMLDDDAMPRGGDVLAECEAGLFDGFRVDADGRIWTSAEDGVHCLTPDGYLIGKIFVPEIVANLCFGGPDRNWLYIAATTSLYRIRLFVRG